MVFPKITPKRVGAGGFFKFLIKNWYSISFLLSILPGLITSFQIAVSTSNPVYPILHSAMSIASADSELYNTVQILMNSPSQYFSYLHPIGIFQSMINIWDNIKVIWLILGDLFLIAFPFVFIHKVIRKSNTSAEWKAMTLTIIFGLVWILFFNLLVAIVQLVSNNPLYTFQAGWDIYQKAWYVIKLSLPFHGTVSLIKYIISLIV